LRSRGLAHYTGRIASSRAVDMSEKKRPRRTRERILETSLALFNRAGEPNVTTAHIADEMNISPGNLYYHFRNKDDIIGELFAAYAAEVAPLLALPPGRAPDVEDLWLMLHLVFERMGAYRFLFRDLDEIASRNRKLALAHAQLVRRGEETIVALCRGMVDAGTMHASEREIAALATNVAMVSTYWLSYQRLTSQAHVKGDADAANPAQAAYQVLALFAPFTSDHTRALIEHLAGRYLAKEIQ
jgi:AcrR family transcriptional regulator